MLDQPETTKSFAATRGDRTAGWLPQTRSEILARNGMVATSQPLAAQAGLQILKNGGNAFDAAVAAASVLNVVEPHSAGIGGDVFVMAWLAAEKRLIALNGSGRAPGLATAAELARRGHVASMPSYGIDSAVAPGAVDAWDVLLKRCGTMSMGSVLQPAVELAEQGFPVSERIQNDWQLSAELLRTDADSARTYLPAGQPPDRYGVFRNPDLARAFRLLQSQGRDAFYQGDIAAAMIAKSRALGGMLSHADLAATRADWVEPLQTRYGGFDVFEFPPNTQGFAALMMLNILTAAQARFGVELRTLGHASPLYWHLLIEAKKLAYEDLYRYNADPEFSQIPTARLLSKDYAELSAAKIDLKRAAPVRADRDPQGGTVYLSTADRFGNMVSFIYSIYESFGGGVTVPGFGFVLNNRAALFSLHPDSPNRVAPGKRPFHTLLPGFVMQNGAPLLSFGLMGGAQQAQGHVQVLVNMIDLHANLQAASDAARFTHAQETNELQLESNLYGAVGETLASLGHQVTCANGEKMGGYQAIARIDGVYRGASDHRKDGQAVGY
jgi:gamma-glutamyltranspeptidase/glutathione hydrolase